MLSGCSKTYALVLAADWRLLPSAFAVRPVYGGLIRFKINFPFFFRSLGSFVLQKQRTFPLDAFR